MFVCGWIFLFVSCAFHFFFFVIGILSKKELTARKECVS